MIGASLLVVCVFILLGQYAYPSADDFCMASGVRDEGLIPHLWNHYLEWSGRYTGNALYAIYPLIFGLFSGYSLMPGIIILMLYVATLSLLSAVFNVSIADKKLWMITLLIICTCLLGLRHSASSLFWMAGALTYQSAHILLLFSLALIVRLKRLQQQQKTSITIQVTLVLLIVLAVGTNEINMLVITTVMLASWVHALWSGCSSTRSWLMLLIVSLACFAIVYFSPGNAIRESTFPLRHDWVRSLKGSLDMGSWTLLVWTGNPVFLAGSLLIPFAVASVNNSSKQTFNISNRLIFSLALVTLSIPVVLQFPAWWSMGGWPPPRTVDAIYFLFLTSWIALLIVLCLRFLPMHLIYDDKKIRAKASILFFIFSLGFLLSITINAKFNSALQDLRYRAKPFHSAMMQRHELIKQSSQQGIYYINVPDLPDDLPYSIYFNDIRKDWRDWRNVCYAKYFGLQGIQRLMSGTVKQKSN